MANRIIGLIILGILILLLAIIRIVTTMTPKVDTLPLQYNNSAWLWDSPLQMDDVKVRELVNFAAEKNIKTIYLFIEDYLAISEKSKSDQAKKTTELALFEDKLKQFISQANLVGIEVEALAGNVNWAEKEYTYIPRAYLDYVLDFNQRNEQQFAGIQFDIEFYNQDDFKKNKQDLTVNYLNLISDLVKRADSKIKIGLAIPHGLDNDKGTVSFVEYNGEEASVLAQLIQILPPKSYLALMAYRNYAEGNNGSIEISRPTLDLVNASGKDIQVYIGMETNENEEEHITFYSKSQNDVNFTAQKLAETFKANDHFAGFAIHTLVGYQQLKD